MTAVQLFDLDGVLTRHDTTAGLVRVRLAGRPFRAAPVLLLALASLLAPATGRLRPRLHRAIMRAAFRGLDEPAWERLVERGVPRLVARGFRNRDGEWALRMARHAGPVLVVTAAEERLARAWLAAIGLPDVPVSGSTARFDGGGVRFADHHEGARKLQRVQAAGIDLGAATMTTDSLSDLPLAAAVRRCVLVNPSRRAAAVARRRCRSVEVVRWQ